MDQLIPIINKLQDVFATIGSNPIDLPQIAVIGSQSVGKSSVLENIVGQDFLPRGSDIVTRRPLILQLFNTRVNKALSLQPINDSKSNEEQQNKEEVWGEFLHTGNKKFYNFNEIRKEIERETNRVCPNKAISYETINLKIYSPHVLNLTLVDLPGMTKVPVGNQPPDIERKIRSLLRSFINRPRCLILAISSATSDLATSDGIQLAKEVDPKGLRTLGVITKLDLMDQGTNCLDALMNNVIPLSLGYVAVVNRSQKDINDGRDIQHARAKEAMFFKSHASYRTITKQCGVQYLSRKLNQILINHIKQHLPHLRQQIDENIREVESELESYGQPLISDSANTQNKGALLLQLISKFNENFHNSIDGRGMLFNTFSSPKKPHLSDSMNSTQSLDLNPNARELFGGARMLYIFRTEFQQQLARIKPFDGLTDDFILNSMRNASGIRSSLFIPEMCFENLVKMQIEKIRRPCLDCVDLVFCELRRIATQCETAEISRFCQFQKSLHLTVNTMLKKYVEPCRSFVNQLIDTELAYINTNHPDFIKLHDVFQQPNESSSYNTLYTNNVQQRPQQQPSQQQQQSLHSASIQQQQQSMNRVPIPNTEQKNDNNSKQSTGIFNTFLFGKSTNNKPKNKKHVVSNSGGVNGNVSEGKNPFHGQPTVQKRHGSFSGVNGNNPSLNNKRSNQPLVYSGINNHFGRSSGSSSSSYMGMYTSPLPNATDRERMELMVIKKFIHSYFEIVKKNAADLVPKTIMFMLVNKSKMRLQQELALELYKEEQFAELLSENPEIAQKRKNAMELLQILQKALAIINDVRDFNMS